MLLKFIIIYLAVQYSRAESIFDSIYKSQVRSRATACVQAGTGGACEGVVWHQNWLLVRGSCIAAHPAEAIYVKKGTVNCTYDSATPSTIGYGELCTRHVVGMYRHRMCPGVDLALLQLDWPYADTETLNFTINELQKLDLWMKVAISNQEQKESNTIDPASWYKMYTTPLRMLLFSVVLPSFSFVIFFVYVIFYTGSNKTTVPYKHLVNEKKICV